MAIQKPGIPKGTRDFGPAEMSKRNFIFNKIKSIFRQHGYAQIETPAMENLDTLLGKYGEEGDKLLFKILNSGDFLSGFEPSKLASEGTNAASLKICEKGLRYDLTVPFARFVVQHQNELNFPFKRYQIQPVWRADRPQKGRYREFYQCDADIIGSNSLLNETDLIKIIDEVFLQLSVPINIKLNNRKILAGIAEYIGQPDKIIEITIALDKLEKIGIEAVSQELQNKGVNVQAIYKLEPLFAISGNNFEKLHQLKNLLHNSEAGTKGIEESRQLLNLLDTFNLTSAVEIDLSLARGLNYYTGTIIEVKASDVEIGSICGGGRYDDLTGIFGLKDISGVGVSFGADRIYDVMEQLNRFTAETVQSSKVMFVNFGAKEAVYCLPLLSKLHQANISAELYPDSVKLQKQMTFANAKNIQFVVLIGENEIKDGLLTVKNMVNGEQFKTTIDELMDIVK
jgi:histidyl-tRNA synthetase